MFETIKKTESFSETYHRTSWDKWSNLGTMCEDKKRIAKAITKNEEEPGTFNFEEKEMINEIYYVFYKVTKDYMDDWSKVGHWPDYIETWDLEDPRWEDGRISFLKYDVSDDSLPYAMDFHTDNHEYDKDSPGNKFIITFTLYINDNYEGGEISFLDDTTGDTIVYKPKAGDITVFPSGDPYYHGVFKIKTGNKYLLRMFWFWDYKGSPGWLENEKKYGKEVWQKMEEERIKLSWHDPKYYRYIEKENK